MKFYVIRLSAEERDELTSLVETDGRPPTGGGMRGSCCWQTRGNTDLDNPTLR